MLSQAESDRLITALKELVDNPNINFPNLGDNIALNSKTLNGSDKFIIDINRKGSLKISKCTYQTRYRKSIILIRLDIDGPSHTNPDGMEIPCPHIHIYKEGFGTKWAYPLSSDFTDSKDLVQTFFDFLVYNKIVNDKEISILGGGLI